MASEWKGRGSMDMCAATLLQPLLQMLCVHVCEGEEREEGEKKKTEGKEQDMLHPIHHSSSHHHHLRHYRPRPLPVSHTTPHHTHPASPTPPHLIHPSSQHISSPSLTSAAAASSRKCNLCCRICSCKQRAMGWLVGWLVGGMCSAASGGGGGGGAAAAALAVEGVLAVVVVVMAAREGEKERERRAVTARWRMCRCASSCV